MASHRLQRIMSCHATVWCRVRGACFFSAVPDLCALVCCLFGMISSDAVETTGTRETSYFSTVEMSAEEASADYLRRTSGDSAATRATSQERSFQAGSGFAI